MKDNGAICPLPWVSVSMNPHGTIRACGHSKAVNSPSLKTSNLTNSWNSEYYKSLRLDMLAGVKNNNCANCHKKEELGGLSKRQESLKEYGYDVFAKTETDGSLLVSPKEIDIRVGNICNLKCVHCWTGNSSKWYEDKLLIDKYENTQGHKIDNKWIDTEPVWNYLKSNIDTISKINFLGGEPFASKQHGNFINWCVQNNKTDFTLHYITNGTLISPKVMDLINQFDLNLGISLDDFGPRSEFLRYPSEWKKIEENLDYINKNNIQFVFFNWTCYNLNISRLDKLIEYTQEQFPNIAFRTANYVTNPKHLSVQVLPKHYKEKVAKKLKNIKQADFYVNYMMEQDLWNDHKDVLYEYLEDLDKVRNTKWKLILPEIAELYD